MKVLGIDMGSREVKIAYMDSGTLVEKRKISTMTFYKSFCIHKDGRLLADVERIGFGKPDKAVSTGYGRNNTDLCSFKPITEIKAHAYGAMYQTKLRDFILLDIGGQDVKVVRVEKGLVTDLELNEKCAASCGRYLENMAAVLEVPLEEMSRHFEAPVPLNSTCSVFSESELIGKIAEGIGIEELCAGVNYSLYKKLSPMLTRFKGEKLVLSGGVAGNKTLQKYLEEDFDSIVHMAEPQFNGAIGCCAYAEFIPTRGGTL